MGQPSFQASNAIIYLTYGAFLVSGLCVAWCWRNQSKSEFLAALRTQKAIPLALNFIASCEYSDLISARCVKRQQGSQRKLSSGPRQQWARRWPTRVPAHEIMTRFVFAALTQAIARSPPTCAHSIREMGKETMGKGSARLHYGCGLQIGRGWIQLFALGV